CARAFDGPEAAQAVDREVLRALGSDADLGLVGLLLALGAFADKAIFAFTLGRPVGWGLRSHAGFEDVTFLAAMIGLPGLVAFLVWLDAPVREAYRDCLRAIGGGTPREGVALRRRAMGASFRTAIARLLEIEAVVAVLALIGAPWILEALRFDAAAAGTFRVAVVATVLQVAVLLHVAVLAYLDARRGALLVAGVFAGANALFAAISAALGSDGAGVGYAAAGLAAVAVAFVAVDRGIADFEYQLFRRQPLEP
ncbi:MAG TPA: exopolysaccharide Pel transporter PelG, partial [Planctomycetota bacterium]|nr:exopolysaccharide Pel transporter PelG [Planctomycetota bacterium]